jgi:hypothetical protein
MQQTICTWNIVRQATNRSRGVGQGTWVVLIFPGETDRLDNKAQMKEEFSYRGEV